MRTEWRVGPRWVWLALILLVFSVLVINATSQSSWADDTTTADICRATAGRRRRRRSAELLLVVHQDVPADRGFILCLSVYFVATCARLFMELRPETAMPPEILSRCEAMLEQRDFKGIFNVVKEDDSYFSRVLVTGITELPNGLSEARESMERVADMLTAEMDKKISMLAVLGQLGPMIGLVGTLKGMITAFSAIAVEGAQFKAARSGQGYFRSPRADAGRGGLGGAVDLLLRLVPQPRVVDLGDVVDACGRVPAALCPGRPHQGGTRRGPGQGVRKLPCPAN